MKETLFGIVAWVLAGLGHALIEASIECMDQGHTGACIVGVIFTFVCYFGFVWGINRYAKEKNGAK